MEVTYTQQDLSNVSKKLLDQFSGQKVWLFVGEMGAGKTTLIKSVCQHLGVVDEMSSPTFSIVNEYRTKTDKEVYHFDFYRMEDQNEAVNIGIEDYFFSGDPCFIEWPEIITPFLPEKYLEISIKLVDSNTRHLTASINDRNL